MARKTGGTGDLLERVRAEIDERMGHLLVHVEEHRQLLSAAASLELDGKASAEPKSTKRAVTARRAAAGKSSAKARRAPAKAKRAASKPPTGKLRGPRSATQQAIEAALEHGSHTISELVLVTAMEAPPIRAQLGRLQKAGVVARVRREGKAAYSLLSDATAAASGPRNGASAK